MYAGKALVHLNDIIGGQKQFNLENDFIEKLSEIKEKQLLPNSSAENAVSIMTYNSLITEYLLGIHDRVDKLRSIKALF